MLNKRIKYFLKAEDDSSFRRLTITTTHHYDDFSFRRLTITTNHHFDDLHHDESPFRRPSITKERSMSRHEREVLLMSRHEREAVTTSHYDDFALRRRPSISMTFHYNETFLTRSPLHRLYSIRL